VRPVPKQEDSRRYGGTIAKEWSGSGIALCPSPDGRNLLVVYANETFTIWDTLTLSEGARQAVPVAGFQCAALSAGAQTAAFIGEGGKVVLWHCDLRTSEEFSLPKHAPSTRAAFSADGRLAIGSIHDVWIFDVSSKTVLSEFQFQDEGAVPDGLVMSLSFSGNSEKLMAGFYSGKVRVWGLTNGSAEVIIEKHTGQVRGLAVLPDNETVVSAGPEVRLWNLRWQREIDSFQPRASSYYGCSISPDGRRLAVGARDGMITIWDLASRREVITLKGHQRAVFDLFFLADGDTLISIGHDEVRVWRAPSLSNATGSVAARF
jgi:WD40 repeat protein